MYAESKYQCDLAKTAQSFLWFLTFTAFINIFEVDQNLDSNDWK